MRTDPCKGPDSLLTLYSGPPKEVFYCLRPEISKYPEHTLEPDSTRPLWSQDCTLFVFVTPSKVCHTDRERVLSTGSILRMWKDIPEF